MLIAKHLIGSSRLEIHKEQTDRRKRYNLKRIPENIIETLNKTPWKENIWNKENQQEIKENKQ
jgi:hypothetical protein